MRSTTRKTLIVTSAVLFGLLLLAATAILCLRHAVTRISRDESPEKFTRALSEPVSLDKAREDMDLPLPDGAKSILYAQYSRWIAYEFILKFEAPLEVCKSHALALLRRHNEDKRIDPVPVELRPFAPTPDSTPKKWVLDVPWFDVHNIKNGFVGGDSGSSLPMIWIDAERGIFYYRCHD